MNKQSPNLPHFRSNFEQKIKYHLNLSYLKQIKNLIKVNKKTSRASNKVKLIYNSFIELSFIVGSVMSTALFAITSAIYMREDINVGSVFIVLCIIFIGCIGWAVSVSNNVFESTPLDTKTLKDLKYYITYSIKENENLDFDYNLINYHLKMINENTGEYAIADLKEIFLHIQYVVNNQKIMIDKKQEVLNLINDVDTTKLNNSNEQLTKTELNIKTVLENTSSLYLKK